MQVAHNSMELEKEKEDAGKELFRTAYVVSCLICEGKEKAYFYKRGNSGYL
jgi:hypothetical protein